MKANTFFRNFIFPMKKVFAVCWTIYAVLTFIVLGSIFFLIELVLLSFGKLTYRMAHRWPAFVTKILLFSWGIRVKQHNQAMLKNLPQSVIILNHRSDLDALIATAYMPDIYKFIGKRELVNYPFIGMLVERLYITVDRSSKESRIQSMRNMKKQGSRGAHIVVFPEGWSNFSDDYLLEFRRGAFKVALDLNLPIVVCTLTGTHERFPKPKIQLTPGAVDMYWETIISTEGLNYVEHVEEIKAQCRTIFLKRLQAVYPEGYPYDRNRMDFEKWKLKHLRKIK